MDGFLTVSGLVSDDSMDKIFPIIGANSAASRHRGDRPTDPHPRRAASPIQLSGISTVDDCKTTAPASIGSAVVVSRFPIVGVGASAGGVEALEALFRPMPAEPGMAFVVIIHLGPNHESMLAEIIARHTAMPVHPIRDGDTVAINHIYVLRHEASLTIAGGQLRLVEPSDTH